MADLYKEIKFVYNKMESVYILEGGHRTVIYYSYLQDTLFSDGAAVWSAVLFYAVGGLIAAYLLGLGGRLFCELCKGDPERFGVSYDPVRNLSVSSVLGWLAFPVFGLGWGKAPQYDPENRGKSFLVAVGGPVLCLVGGFLFLMLYRWLTGAAVLGSLLMGTATACFSFALFSLLPVPGLRGGVALSSLLSEKLGAKWNSLRAFSPLFLTLVLLLLARSGLHTPVIGALINSLGNIFA